MLTKFMFVFIQDFLESGTRRRTVCSFMAWHVQTFVYLLTTSYLLPWAQYWMLSESTYTQLALKLCWFKKCEVCSLKIASSCKQEYNWHLKFSISFTVVFVYHVTCFRSLKWPLTPLIISYSYFVICDYQQEIVDTGIYLVFMKALGS